MMHLIEVDFMLMMRSLNLLLFFEFLESSLLVPGYFIKLLIIIS